MDLHVFRNYLRYYVFLWYFRRSVVLVLPVYIPSPTPLFQLLSHLTVQFYYSLSPFTAPEFHSILTNDSLLVSKFYEYLHLSTYILIFEATKNLHMRENVLFVFLGLGFLNHNDLFQSRHFLQLYQFVFLQFMEHIFIICISADGHIGCFLMPGCSE